MTVVPRGTARIRGPRRSLLDALLLSGLLVSLMGARCPLRSKQAAVKPVAARSVIPDSADQVVRGMSTILNDGGVLKGILLSDSAYTYDEGARLELFGVNVTFYTATGVKNGVMFARSGTYNSRLSRLEARGDVVVKQDDGKSLTTPKLVYDQARNQIFTDSAFVLTQPGQQLPGIGFESDPQLRVFRCFAACKPTGTVKIPAR